MRIVIGILAFATLASGSAGAALAQQRDPAYQAARSQGLVGEMPDGYLGIVGTPTPELRALVNNINIQRKKAYTEGAGAGSTIEQFAFVSGCNLIRQTVAGEKYQTPDGRWLTRDAGAPVRDPRCV